MKSTSCLEEEQQVDCRGHDVGGDDDPVAGLLDRGEDADDGAGGEQEHRHGGELPSVSVAVVGDDLKCMEHITTGAFGIFGTHIGRDCLPLH